MFVNPAGGDFSVKAGSPALTLGFTNLPHDRIRRHVGAPRAGSANAGDDEELKHDVHSTSSRITNRFCFLRTPPSRR
jgi:hypothetical protein